MAAVGSGLPHAQHSLGNAQSSHVDGAGSTRIRWSSDGAVRIGEPESYLAWGPALMTSSAGQSRRHSPTETTVLDMLATSIPGLRYSVLNASFLFPLH